MFYIYRFKEVLSKRPYFILSLIIFKLDKKGNKRRGPFFDIIDIKNLYETDALTSFQSVFDCTSEK